MIEIRKYDRQGDVAKSVYAVMKSVYPTSPWSLEQIRVDMAKEDTTYYLAYEEKNVVGFLAVQLLLDEMEILQIAVHTDFQRCGIASRLLDCLGDWAGPIFLEVRASNHSAQSLYTRQHFIQIGKRKDYYHNPIEDAVIMMRRKNER